MTSIDSITLEVDDPTEAGRFYTVAFGLGDRLVLRASHLTSTSGSQIAVIIEPASRAELEPVIAAG